MREKINFLLHGVPKSGKSLFAVRRNPGVLLLDTEGSTKLVKGIKREVVKSMSDMDSVLARIKSGEVNLVVIDTLDELINNFGKHEAKTKSPDFVNKLGMLTMPGWGYMRDRFMSITRSYRDAGADVLTICHSEIVELPNGSKQWKMKLPSDYAREVMGMMDVVGFTEIVKDLTTGKNAYRVHFSPSPMFDAGVRAIYDAVTDTLSSPLPEYLDDSALVDVLKAYDEFLEGDGSGFSVKCQNCQTKGTVSPATKEIDEMYLCEECHDRYVSIKQSNNPSEKEEVTTQ